MAEETHPPAALTELPVLPLRDVVVFPHLVIPLFVGRAKSIRALELAMEADKRILLVTQKDEGDDDPDIEGINTIGCISTVLQLLKLPDNTVKVLVEGGHRAEVVRYTDTDEMFAAEVRELSGGCEADPRELEALSRSVVSQFEQYVKVNKKVPPEILSSLSGIDDANRLADTVAAHLSLKTGEKQALLEIDPTNWKNSHKK